MEKKKAKQLEIDDVDDEESLIRYLERFEAEKLAKKAELFSEHMNTMSETTRAELNKTMREYHARKGECVEELEELVQEGIDSMPDEPDVFRKLRVARMKLVINEFKELTREFNKQLGRHGFPKKCYVRQNIRLKNIH